MSEVIAVREVSKRLKEKRWSKIFAWLEQHSIEILLIEDPKGGQRADEWGCTEEGYMVLQEKLQGGSKAVEVADVADVADVPEVEEVFDAPDGDTKLREDEELKQRVRKLGIDEQYEIDSLEATFVDDVKVIEGEMNTIADAQVRRVLSKRRDMLENEAYQKKSNERFRHSVTLRNIKNELSELNIKLDISPEDEKEYIRLMISKKEGKIQLDIDSHNKTMARIEEKYSKKFELLDTEELEIRDTINNRFDREKISHKRFDYEIEKKDIQERYNQRRDELESLVS